MGRLKIKASELAQEIASLPADKIVYYYEILANELTISVRAVWSDDDLSDAEKVDQLKWINEIQHRVVSKIQIERLREHSWPDCEFIEMVNHYCSLNPNIKKVVGEALNRAWCITKSK